MPTVELDRAKPKRDWLTPPPARSGPGADRPARSGGSGEAEGPRQDRAGAPRPNAETGDPKQAGGKRPPEASPKRRPLWPIALAGVVVLGFAAVVLWIIFRPRADVWTDDAYVAVHFTSVAPRVSGQIAAVPVENNQVVKAGDLLAVIDPSDYQAAFDAAQAQLRRDEARAGDVGATIERQPAIIDQSSAEVEAARARLAYAQADARRFENLAATGAGTNQQHQQADTTLQQSQASLRAAQAGVEAAQKQLDVFRKQREASEAAVQADRAQLEQARLNLGYTRLLAPLDGMVARRAVQVGDYVAPGGTLMVLVPLQDVYVEANYREVELAHVRAGQHATVHVDAYDIDLDGVVNGVPAASGASFSPIPPDNATGNFTKIVQRLPVRIDIAPNQPLAKLLRVGFSVETTIHTGLQDIVAEQLHDPRAVTGR